MEKANKNVYEKPAVRELSLKGAFAIGTYSYQPGGNGTVDPNDILVRP